MFFIGFFEVFGPKTSGKPIKRVTIYMLFQIRLENTIWSFWSRRKVFWRVKMTQIILNLFICFFSTITEKHWWCPYEVSRGYIRKVKKNLPSNFSKISLPKILTKPFTLFKPKHQKSRELETSPVMIFELYVSS